MEKCAVSQLFKLFVEILDIVSSRPKGKGPSRLSSAQSSKASSCVGVVFVLIVWVSCTSTKGPLMLKVTYKFWSNICCHPNNVFFLEVHSYFRKTIPSHILRVTTVWLLRKIEWILDWTVDNPDPSHIKNM